MAPPTAGEEETEGGGGGRRGRKGRRRRRRRGRKGRRTERRAGRARLENAVFPLSFPCSVYISFRHLSSADRDGGEPRRKGIPKLRSGFAEEWRAGPGNGKIM